MIDGVKHQADCGPIYLFVKRHYCVNCNSLLKRKIKTKVVNSNSNEAKDYDFFQVDAFIEGNIKFITYYFQCPICNKIFSIKEMKELKI